MLRNLVKLIIKYNSKSVFINDLPIVFHKFEYLELLSQEGRYNLTAHLKNQFIQLLYCEKLLDLRITLRLTQEYRCDDWMK